MSDLITVIVPIYKVQNFLDQCVQSIVEQTYSDLEIILIDDGSSDDCAQACDYWAVKDDRVRIIHKPNGGLSSARNAGLDICTGEYITYIDSDDWVECNYIEILLNALVMNCADISSVNEVVYEEGTGKKYIIYKKEFTAGPEETLMKLYDQNEFPVDSIRKMFASYIWKDLRFPVGHNYEDAYTTYLAVDAAKTIVHLADAPYYYRVRSNSIMTSHFSMSTIDRSNTWKENYFFCKEKYPRVAPYARMFWLEHIPPILASFPEEMNEEERAAKRKLKTEIRDNIAFILMKMPFKKVYYQIKGLLFL